ncbi:hypothetical protein CC78DRAFT_580172 [Lojkania enalia]|uniref:Rhodopsin domain-containing protein n=1 Tax=Lojkania enalia TaxID=147567 RepID=A0A9P4KDW0_9PLEO|nr:hypothetical protein CC78DRAFT_580172 [Didymosphaeria enalia]
MFPEDAFSTNASIATSIINLVSDFTILLIPEYTIMWLHVPLRKKTGVGAVFAIGALACAAGIMRLFYDIHITRISDVT